MENNDVGVLSGLKVIKDQRAALALAFSTSLIILSLDYFLTANMSSIIEGITNILSAESGLKVPPVLLVLCLLIVLRPLIGWVVNFVQTSILHSILRKLETKISKSSRNKFLNEPKSYSSEVSANILISHGRYFIDDFLSPLLRAVTDVGVITVISFGLFLQYSVPLIFFIASAVTLLAGYQFLSRKVLQVNGEIKLRCYEAIIKSSREGFYNIEKTPHRVDGSSENYVLIHEILDDKRKAGIVIGSLSQGLKYVVEFTFMASFAFASIAVILNEPSQFAAFIATFAYAGVRMLPAFTSVIAFFHSKSAANHAIKELVEHLDG